MNEWEVILGPSFTALPYFYRHTREKPKAAPTRWRIADPHVPSKSSDRLPKQGRAILCYLRTIASLLTL